MTLPPDMKLDAYHSHSFSFSDSPHRRKRTEASLPIYIFCDTERHHCWIYSLFSNSSELGLDGPRFRQAAKQHLLQWRWAAAAWNFWNNSGQLHLRFCLRFCLVFCFGMDVWPRWVLFCNAMGMDDLTRYPKSEMRVGCYFLRFSFPSLYY